MIYIGLAIGVAVGMFIMKLANNNTKKDYEYLVRRYHFVARRKKKQDDEGLAERLKKIEDEIFEFEK